MAESTELPASFCAGSRCKPYVALITGVLATLALFWWRDSFSTYKNFATVNGDSADDRLSTPPFRVTSREEVIHLLEEKGVYRESDFTIKNDWGAVAPYWGTDSGETTTRSTTIPKGTTAPEWGPCFAPRKIVDWDRAIAISQNSTTPQYETQIGALVGSMSGEDLAGFCRPGFVIIGAGKCGTSSLYHYLTDHPRVLPASQKQIHYFKYYPGRTMKWYLHHFPTTTSFMASGALMTGEASPGYLPYPDVVRLMHQRLGDGPRIIVVGREPVDRAYSSYRYNYVYPTIQSMHRGRVKGVQRGKTDDFYLKYLFSFEDMMRAELAVLRECLAAPNGTAILGARNSYGSQPWLQNEYQRREELGLPPLADLDGHCYGDQVDSKILRKQWIGLMEQYPDKIIQDDIVHLTQAMIGRGLYTLPLEWWYAVYKPSDIYFICTEELSDMSGEPLNRLGQFLGLSSFNFSNTVTKGAYNVGGHRGYDKETAWTELENEQVSNETILVEADEIPLSEELRKEVEDFIRPYNERLFALVGRRCNW